VNLATYSPAWKWIIVGAFAAVYGWGIIRAIVEDHDNVARLLRKVWRDRWRVLFMAVVAAGFLFVALRDRDLGLIMVGAWLGWAAAMAWSKRDAAPKPEELPSDDELGRTMRELLKQSEPSE
jgi:hypothetical protein